MRVSIFLQCKVALLAVPLFGATALAQSGETASPPSAANPSAAPRTSGTLVARALSELDAWVLRNRGRLGAMIVDVPSGEVLAARAEHVLMNPASNQKLLTAAAALARLGPDFRFTTGLYGELRDGSVKELVIRGHGDPSLRADHLFRLARAAAAIGLRRVDGDIIVDQTRFDERFVPPAFEQQPDEWSSFRAPVSAIALDRNVVTIDVFAGRAGEPARVSVEPPGAAAVIGSVRTVEVGGGQAVSVAMGADRGRLAIRLGGRVAEGLPRVRLVRRVDDPRLVPGNALVEALRQAGIEVRGAVKPGALAGQPRIVFHESETLASLVHELGKNSDNFYAEMLMKTLGAEVKGSPATSAAGAEVIRDWLAEAGALEPGTVIVNGSGLFDANRVSAWTLARSLRSAYLDSRVGPELVAELAIGGVDGTLRSRFRSLRVRRSIRAKTGTLNRVVALSGYVLGPASRGPVAFSIIVADLGGKQPEARRRVDAVVEKIASTLEHGAP